MSTPSESEASTMDQTTIPLGKLSAQGKATLRLAQEEARTFRHNYIGTEHLLLGLLRGTDNPATVTLANLGVTLAKTRVAVERIIGYGEVTPEGKLAPTPRALKVISLSVGEAERLKQPLVEPEHILLGLLHEGEGIATGILTTFGADANKVQMHLFQAIAQAGGVTPSEPMPPKSNVVACRIDKRDLDAIDALIEAGIRSTRSDAASWLIHAGIEANKPLFEKVNGTVAEIRRLRASMQQFVQETKQQDTATSEGEQELPPKGPPQTQQESEPE